METKLKTPEAGDIIVVNHENSSETYFFDGNNLIDSVGTMFSNINIDWNKLWDNDKTWRFANSEEMVDYAAELKKSNLFINQRTKKIFYNDCEKENASVVEYGYVSLKENSNISTICDITTNATAKDANYYWWYNHTFNNNKEDFKLCKKQIIDDAAQWLNDNVWRYVRDSKYYTRIAVSSLVNDFRKNLSKYE